MKSQSAFDINYITITLQRRLKQPKHVETIPLLKALESIRSNEFKPQIRRIRDLLKEENEAQSSKIKEGLPTYLFSGVFREGTNAGLEKHSGLVILDFDDMPEDLTVPSKARLAQHPSAVAVFVSPSGTGLKCIFWTNADDKATHTKCFEACIEVITRKYADLQQFVDTGGKDVSRRCFVSHDPP